ncbi:hypothetical protein HOO34_03355 [Aliarcobacter cryaerophilus]|uniref:SGNH/GDSL hydrolase family protein n=1 Tax=Aliarcobacter cryaerophilus TaxID=28198 RepID=A0A7G9LQ72_9BACT|nr:hypothetical protein [Aliarcobacter cryaerophilus]QNM90771.1 hypothetical protein HOO34_03355 [Aliarcobacter cryaerophilus]
MSYIFIIFALIIFIVIINKLFKNTNFYKNKFIDTHKFKDIPRNLDIVNLGSNQPKFAFDYSKTNNLGMNWGVGPQALEYDFRILKNFYNYLKPNAKVLITISPFQFFLLDYKDDTSNHKYYNFLDSNFIDNYSNITKKLYIDYPIITAKKQILRILKDTKPDTRLEFEENPMSKDEIKKDALNWMNGWKKQFGINDLENIVLSEENKINIEKNIYILKNMIDFCIEKNIQPVLTIIPVTKELSKHFPDKFVQEQIIDYINKANDKNVRFLNYWKDERFEDESYYINSFFMNKIGRLKFTEQVLKDLNI